LHREQRILNNHIYLQVSVRVAVALPLNRDHLPRLCERLQVAFISTELLPSACVSLFGFRVAPRVSAEVGDDGVEGGVLFACEALLFMAVNIGGFIIAFTFCVDLP
jgi:hypothetical protein